MSTVTQSHYLTDFFYYFTKSEESTESVDSYESRHWLESDFIKDIKNTFITDLLPIFNYKSMTTELIFICKIVLLFYQEIVK